MILFIIYLLGIVPAYLLYREWYRRDIAWTIGSRKFGFFVALTSWIGVLTTIIAFGIDSLDREDTPAKW